MSDEVFAMRFRAIRAAKLAATITRAYEQLGDQSASPVALAERLTDAQWETVALVAGISPPSPTTKAMCIGLLSMPELKGLAI